MFAALLVLLVFCMLCFSAGTVLLSRISQDGIVPEESVFVKFFVGLILLVTGYSILKSHGATINWLFILVLLVIYFFLKKGKTQRLFFVRNEIKPLITLCSFIGCWSLYFLGIDTLFELKNPSEVYPYSVDFTYYLSIVQGFVDTGVENNLGFLNSFSDNYHSISNYHFFHFWIAAFIHEVGSISAAKSLFYVSFPILLGMSSFVVFQLLRKVSVPVLFSALAAIVLFFAKGFVDKSQVRFFYLIVSPASQPKVADYYLFVLVSIYLVVSGRERFKWIPLVFLNLFSFLASPVVVCAWMLETCYYVLTRKWQERKYSILLSAALLFASMLGQLILSKLFKPTLASVNHMKLTFSVQPLLQSSFVFVKESFVFLAPTILFILLSLITFWKKKEQNVFFSRASFLFLLPIFFSGVACASIFQNDINHWQMFINTSLTAVFVFSFLYVLFLLREKKWWLFIFLGFELLVTVFSIAHNSYPTLYAFFYHAGNSYDKTYVQQCNAALKDAKYVGYIKSKVDYNDPYIFTPLISNLANYLALNENPQSLICLSPENIPLLNQDDSVKLNYAYYKMYSEELKRSHPSIEADSCMNSFLLKYQVNYILLSKNAELPNALINRVSAKYQDKITGEKFIVLRN
jgi:hypothetical protein